MPVIVPLAVALNFTPSTTGRVSGLAATAGTAVLSQRVLVTTWSTWADVLGAKWMIACPSGVSPPR